MFARRDLLAAAFGLTVPPADWLLILQPPGKVVLSDPCGRTRLVLPDVECRLLATFTLNVARCAAIRFAALTAKREAMAVVAVAGAGGLLALEPWSGQAANGAHLSTRLEVMPAGRGLVLRRDAAMPRATHSLWQRQAWSDVLMWDSGRLVDAPVRPPLAGTWQDAVAHRRAVILARLDQPIDMLAARAAIWPWDRDA